MNITQLIIPRQLILFSVYMAVLIYLASSAPTPGENQISTSEARPRLSESWEEARQIWNEFKRSQKQFAAIENARTKRNDLQSSTPGPTPKPMDHNELNNLSVPAYVKELYWNISHQDANSKDSETTIIRSLPALHTADGCGFNFSISEVSQFEIFRRADLRIHMKQPSGAQVNSVYLQLYHGKHKGDYKIVYPNREGWIVFDVLNHIRRWRDHGHPNKSIHFYIRTYTSEYDFQKGQNWKTCNDSPIQFDRALVPGTEHDGHAEDLQPLLMIYSRDFDTVNFNLSKIIDNEHLVNKRSDPENTVTEPETEPPITVPPATEDLLPLAQMDTCRKHNLQIDLDQFNTIWHLAQSTQTAIYPTTFDINICGGGCHRDIPITSAQHSFIVYYLHTRVPVSHRGVEWGECCAPVKYKNIETLFKLPDGEFRIVTIRDISVEQCTCLTIYQKPPSNRR